MKRCLILMSLLAICSAALGVTIGWNDSPRATGYRVYHGRASRNYTNSIDAGSWTNLSFRLPSGTNYIAVTAYNAVGESGFSDELVFVPPQPLQLRVETSDELSGPWLPIFATTVTNSRQQRFFRTILTSEATQ
jgi:hypothetical protein